MNITPLGDSALTVRVRTEFASDPEGCLREVSSVLRRVQAARLPGVLEVTPAFTTVAVFYDPAQAAAAGAPADNIFEWLAEKIAALPVAAGIADPGSGKVMEIPVCYADEFAPDLEIVATHTRLTATEVIRAHSAAIYRVGYIGFVPGFPFLTGLPPALATPRRATPRVQVAVGSVAIGGAQTGVYPQPSPGGWNVIGRTPRRLFDARREPPALLAAGDLVRFRSITRAEFKAFSE